MELLRYILFQLHRSKYFTIRSVSFTYLHLSGPSALYRFNIPTIAAFSFFSSVICHQPGPRCGVSAYNFSVAFLRRLAFLSSHRFLSVFSPVCPLQEFFAKQILLLTGISSASDFMPDQHTIIAIDNINQNRFFAIPTFFLCYFQKKVRHLACIVNRILVKWLKLI